MKIKNKVLIRCVGKKTRSHRHRRSRSFRKILFHETSENLFVPMGRLSAQQVRIDLFFQMVPLSQLKTRVLKYWKTVESSFVYANIKNRKTLRQEVLKRKRLKPTNHLSLWNGNRCDRFHQL